MSGSIRRFGPRRRVLAIFLIAVLLPCLFLSYVGLKSLQEEKIRQQQLVEQNLQGSLISAVSRVEKQFEDFIQNTLAPASALTFPLTAQEFLTLRRISKSQPIIDGVFVLDSDFRPIYPRDFLSSGRSPRTIDFNEGEKETLRVGEQLEAAREYDGAIQEFKKELPQLKSLPKTLAFMLRIARCQFKESNLDSCRSIYWNIITSDNGNFYGEEIPYAVIAYNQLIAIAEKANSRKELAKILTEFYESLLQHHDKLEVSQFEYFCDQAVSKLTQLRDRPGITDHNKIELLVEAEREITKSHKFSESLKKYMIPRIERDFPSMPQRNEIQYLTIGYDTVVSRNAYRAIEPNIAGVVGLKFNNSILLDTLETLLRATAIVPPTLTVSFIQGDQKSGLPKTSQRAPLLKTQFGKFTKLIPNYEVGLFATKENPIEQLYATSIFTYYVLIFVILGVIALGILLIFRDISREQELSRMKSEFIANVTHEIKTPIATIRTLVENLHEGWIADQGKQKEYFRLITREAERLSHLVGNILDFSRIEAKRKTYHKEFLPIRNVVEKTLDRFRLQVDGQGVTLKADIADDLPKVRIDVDAIEQVLLNLLDNAVKYSHDEKYVEIGITQDHDRIRIKISDRGIGIDKKETVKLFEKFYRVEAAGGQKVAGSGIGLTIVQEIVQAHGGTIEVQSELNKGTCFTVTIPTNGE